MTQNKEHLGRADIHNHTKYSDGTMTPLQLLRSFRAKKIDVGAVTDHNSIRAYWEMKELMAKQEKDFKNFWLIAGNEVTTPFHLLVLFSNDPFEIPQLRGIRTIDYILDRDEKALIVVPHPGKDPRFLLDPNFYIRNRIHGIEKLSPYNFPFGWLVAIRCEELKEEGVIFSEMSAGDNHHEFPFGNGHPHITLFLGRTKKDFFGAARNGKTIDYFDNQIQEQVRRPTAEMTAERHYRAVTSPFLPPFRR